MTYTPAVASDVSDTIGAAKGEGDGVGDREGEGNAEEADGGTLSACLLHPPKRRKTQSAKQKNLLRMRLKALPKNNFVTIL